MDAKSKANFINSVASNTVISCPSCGATNKSGSKFCTSCGVKLEENHSAEPPASASQAAAEPSAPASQAAAEPSAPQTRHDRYVEPNTVFAQGLPGWSIEPPQIMVRRR